MGHISSSLHDAVKSGNIKLTKQLLKRAREDVNQMKEHQSALFLAVSQGNEWLVEMLLSYGANPNITCQIKSQSVHQFKWTALHEAARLGDNDILQQLLDACGEVNLTAHHEMTPLHVAAWHGYTDVIQTLVHAGCDVNRLDVFQESALVIPICHGDTEVVNVLLEAGCKLNGRSWGNTRKIRGKYEMDYQQSLHGRCGPYTLLLLAIKYAWLQIAMILLQHGFNPNKYQMHDILKALKSSLGPGILSDEVRHLVDCVISAGYRFKENDDRLLDALLQLPEHGYDEHLISWLKACGSAPYSLRQLSRMATRNHLRCITRQSSIWKIIYELPIPKSFKRLPGNARV